MEQNAYTGTASLEEFTEAFRRRWWVIVLCALLGIGGAVGYLHVAPKTYVATASVLVAPVGGAGDNVVEGARTNSLINMDTEAQVVKSQKVSDKARTLLQTNELVGQLVQQVQVTVPANTNVLRISFTASHPDAAAAGANSYAQGYLDNRTDLATAANSAQIQLLKQKIRKLTATYLAQSGPQKALTLSDLTTLKLRYNSLISTAVTPGDIISNALAPNRPASPSPKFILFTGMALGILLGLALVALLEYRDGRFHDWHIVERRLGLPVLANIPGSKGSTAEVYAVQTPEGQAFVELRTALTGGLPGSHHVVVLASPVRGNGLDMVVANLAIATARANVATCVLVVDERSHVTDLLGVPMGDGLTDVLAGTSTLSTVTLATDISGLSVVPSGSDLKQRVEDLEGAGVLPVVKTLQERHDLLLILTAPQKESADAQFLGFHADAAIPVIELAKVKRAAVAMAVREWEIVGTPVPGAVTVPAVSEPKPWPAPQQTSRKGRKR
jgi:capsular polysaccharide biosynthesis protein/Mrp family chromosome partitioning ATPase